MKRITICMIIFILLTNILVHTYIFGEHAFSEAFADKSLQISSAIRLKELGVFLKSNDGFGLDNNVTRLEGLAVLIRLAGKEKDTDRYSDTECEFYDVPEWGIKYINFALDNDLIKGVGDNYFRSQNDLSTKEFIVFLLRALGYSEAEGDFTYDTAIEKSIAIGISKKGEESTFNSTTLTRGALSVLSCRALDTSTKLENKKLGSTLAYINTSEGAMGFDVLKYGAHGDGKRDDTYAIQKVIDKYDEVYIPDGVYLIDGKVGLRPRSNQTIKLSENAVLKIKPNSSPYYFCFLVSDVRNTIIQGGTIVGDRYSHKGNDGEGGIGIDIRSNSSDITIKNMRIKEFLGDGIIIGDNVSPENITLESVICSDNKRNGLSVTNSSNITIKDCLFEASNGGSSQAGIDIGAKTGRSVKNISILNTYTIDNKGDGISISGEKGEIRGVTIDNCYSGNNDSGIYLNTCKNIRIENSVFLNNLTYGMTFIRDIIDVRCYRVSAASNGNRGVSLVVTEQKEGTRNIDFVNCVFSNNSQSDPEKYDAVRIDNYDSSRLLEKIGFSSCSFTDSQKAPTQRYGLTVGDNPAFIRDVIVETSCVFRGNSVHDMISNDIVSMRVPENCGNTLNVRDAGAKGDGITDDTAVIQRALLASKNIVVPAGIYLINTKEGINVCSNQSIVFEEGAIFKAIPNSEEYYCILNLSDVRNVSIVGGVFVGDRDKHLGKSGEWGKGISINSDSRNISIKGSRFERFWGDGIYIGGGMPPENIDIDGVLCSNNLRSGISVTGVKDLKISNSVFCNSNGKEPETGINIEPGQEDFCEDITISSTKCHNNAGNGINLLGSIKNIMISDTETYRNTDGIYVDNCEDITIESSEITENRNFGLSVARDVLNGNFNNLTISKNASLGASLVTTSQKKGLKGLIFTGCVFSNNSLSKPNANDGIRIGMHDGTGLISNISFYSCSFIDNQDSRTQRYGIIIYKEGKVSDIYIDDTCYFRGNIEGNIKY